MVYSVLALSHCHLQCRRLFDFTGLRLNRTLSLFSSTSTPPVQLKPPKQHITGRRSSQGFFPPLFFFFFYHTHFKCPKVISLLPRLAQDVQAALPASQPRPPGRCKPTVWKLQPAGGLTHRGQPQLHDWSQVSPAAPHEGRPATQTTV